MPSRPAQPPRSSGSGPSAAHCPFLNIAVPKSNIFGQYDRCYVPINERGARRMNDTLSTVPDAVAAIADGGFVIVVDDEERENEGDLIIAAEHASPAKLAFMI